MDKDKVFFNELISNMFAEAKRLGFTGYYIWHYLANGCGAVRKYYKSHGIVFYSVEATLESLKDIEARYENGELSYMYMSSIRNAIKRMNEFFLTGTLQANGTRVSTHYLLRGENERMAEEFVHIAGYKEKAAMSLHRKVDLDCGICLVLHIVLLPCFSSVSVVGSVTAFTPFLHRLSPEISLRFQYLYCTKHNCLCQ